jgi:GNAT superfamily N-acetyltransferase
LSGHIALYSSGSVAMMEAACRATGLLSSQLAVIARLFVAPNARRAGVGRALLAMATEEAHDRKCVPVLEVTPALESAVHLYESCGWTRVDEVQARFRDGSSLPVYVYVGPKRLRVTTTMSAW